MFDTQKIIDRDDDSRIRIVRDYEHVPMYGLDTEEETQEAIDYETKMLNSGEWIALGVILEKRCPTCNTWHETDSLWGIVVENSEKGFMEAAEFI